MSTVMPTTEDAPGVHPLPHAQHIGDAHDEQGIKPTTFNATSAGLITLLVLAVSADRLGLGASSLNLRTELLAGGLAVLILLLRNWRALLRGWGLVDACLSGWFAVNLVSSLLFSPELKESLKYVAILAGLLTIYIACRLLITSEAALAWATAMFIVIGAGTALLGLVCALLFNIIGPNFGVLLERFYRDGVFVVTPKVQGILWEPNIYGSFSLAVAALAGALSLRKPPGDAPHPEPSVAAFAQRVLRSPLVLTLAVVAGMSGVMLSMTRTVWLIGPALILLLGATAWKIKLAGSRTIATHLLLPALLGCIIGLGVGLSLPAPQWKMGEPWELTAAQVDDMVRQRLFTNNAPAQPPTPQSNATPLAAGESSAPADRVGELLDPGVAPSLTSRWRIYTDAFNGWLRRPVLGWGAGTFPYVYPPPPEGGDWIANIELHALFDTGIIGLLLLAAAAIIAGLRAVKTLRLPPARWEPANYLTFGILFASLGLLAAFQITDGTWLGFSWVLLAMLVASSRKTADRRRMTDDGRPTTDKGQPKTYDLRPTTYDSSRLPLRALGGVLSLVGRDIAAKLLAFAGWIILARLLDPATFGLFAIAAFVLSVFALFSQLGFGAAVVRDRQSIPRARLDALFTLQLAVVTALSMLLLALAPVVSLLTGDPGTGWLVASLAGALLLLSLRSLPSAMQERDLAYGAPVLADLVSQVSYWLIALPLAWLGWGVWSVVWSVLLSSALGTLVLLVKTRWRPRLNFDWRGLRGDTMFGLMYASQALSHSLKYAILPGLGGALYGGIVVGYLTWTHQIAALPGQFSQLVSRVNYPALSHLQDHRDEFARLAANSLAWTCRLLFPAFAVLIGLAPQITEYVYGAKWLPAVYTLVILSLSMVASSVAGVLLPALYSLGRERTGTFIALGWPAFTWLVAGILAVAGLDFNSIAWAYLAASVLALIATLYALRDLGLTRLLGPLPLPALSSTAIGLACWLVAPGLVHNLLSLIALAAVGGLLALGISLWPARAQAFRLLKEFTDRRWTTGDA